MQPDKSLRSRIATAIVGLIVILPVVHDGGAWFFALTCLLALIALHELGAAARQAQTPLVGVIAWPALLVLLAATHAKAAAEDYGLGTTPLSWPLAPAAGLAVLLLAWAVLWHGSPRRVELSSVALTLLGLCYVGMFCFLPLLRAWPGQGEALTWLTLLGVWASDTAAYFGGRRFGRARLTSLSPGKTREGTVAGLAAAIVVALVVARLGGLPMRQGLVLGVLVGLAAPLGDLIESYWKRELGVKDFGRLLPGHGGVLDRCDSLMLAAFVVYCYAAWVIGVPLDI